MRCNDKEIIKTVSETGRRITLDERIESHETAVAILDCFCPHNGRNFQILADLDEQVRESIAEVASGERSMNNNISDFSLLAVPTTLIASIMAQ